MSIKFKTLETKFPEIKKTLQAIDGKSVTVGVSGEQAWLASIHEYGCRIKVTPKMRKWLHANGLHIKDTTTEIVIPERSFLRSGFDSVHKDVLKEAEKAIELMLDGIWSDTDLYNHIGAALRDGIKEYAVDLRDPPKHPFTLQRAPSKTNPLVNTGDMINSIEYEVK